MFIIIFLNYFVIYFVEVKVRKLILINVFTKKDIYRWG
ncbi:MAG: hypothetical protein MRECE_45c015 [Mycoplasmataceae bacterium CE_OT135]|nr:MAG: hypothetical protein MRECE_45c015 [Mycoplasmataceae bacterium CE_OT135]